MSDRQERTDEEREAARLERERRRAQRTDELSYEEDGFEAGDDGEDGAAADEEDDDEVPVGTKRISHLQRQGIAGSSARTVRRPTRPAKARARKPRAAPKRAAKPRQPKTGQRRHSWALRVVSVLALLLAGGLIWFLVELLQPFHGSGHGRVTVTIPPHSSASQVGDLLERDGVIASSFFFDARATLAGDRSDLRSGTYRLKLDMPYSAVLTALTTPPHAAKVSNLTIIEGRTRRQIDALLRSQGVKGSYLVATRHSRVLDPRAYGAPRSTPTLEGFLFPSTYQLRAPIRIGALIADQLHTFKTEFASVNLAYARRRHLTPYDILIVASMVQAEAATAHDRPLIASVVYNRLADGMPLQIDATTRYATNNYTRPLTLSELNSSSPYNTRIHTGLPPTPIDNPGLASIEAAAHPARTNDLYFVVKPCGNGEQVFTSSYAQFLRDAQRYQAARSARGGRSPAHC